jgi:DNA-binding Lrp family transcriptional regulator
MDKIDLFIIRRLLENSRLTYRELSDMIDMSVSAVHKRIRSLEDDGVINAYIARPSLISLKYLWVAMFGISHAKSLDLVSKELGQHENVSMVSITGGKFIYIKAYLRDISELQEYTSHVSKVAQISEPTVGIVDVPYVTTPEPLTSVDYKILKTINKDARKPITDIADDVGISAKTVRKRLNRMIEHKLVSFTIQWSPMYENSYFTLFYLFLNEGTDLNSAIQYLNEKHSQNIAYCLTFSNIPNLILLCTLTRTSKDTQIIQEELHTEGLKDVIPHIFFSIKWYDCWVDQLLRTK